MIRVGTVVRLRDDHRASGPVTRIVTDPVYGERSSDTYFTIAGVGLLIPRSRVERDPHAPKEHGSHTR